MRSFRPARIFRLTLAISVSLWMAGAGCLLGCSNAVHASPQNPNDDVNTVVADDSCAAKHSHDCCAKGAKKQTTTSVQTPLLVPEIKAGPRSMKDCPLAINSSAVVSKARSDASDQALSREISSFVVPKQSNNFSRSRSSESLLLNRGPTYLRCCVFLI
jgi:hypothetical protein